MEIVCLPNWRLDGTTKGVRMYGEIHLQCAWLQNVCITSRKEQYLAFDSRYEKECVVSRYEEECNEMVGRQLGDDTKESVFEVRKRGIVDMHGD